MELEAMRAASRLRALPCIEACLLLINASSPANVSSTFETFLRGSQGGARGPMDLISAIDYEPTTVIQSFDCNALCADTLHPCPIYFGAETQPTGEPHYMKLKCNSYNKCNWHIIHWINLWVVALVFDVVVIWYHISTPPHPKFLLRTANKISIRDHAISGCVEIIAGLFAFFLSDPKPAVQVQLIAAVFFHLPADIFQTPNVFGVRAIMVPAYSLIVFTKALCAFNLWYDQYSLQKLIMLVMVHHIYVFCRVMMMLFTKVGIMRAHEYTVSILIAGLICVPCVLGPSGNLYIMMALAAYMLFLIPARTSKFMLKNCKSCHITQEQAEVLLVESHRELFENKFFTEHLKVLTDNAKVVENDGGEERKEKIEKMAKEWYNELDADKNGELTVAELKMALRKDAKRGGNKLSDVTKDLLEQLGDVKRAALTHSNKFITEHDLRVVVRLEMMSGSLSHGVNLERLCDDFKEWSKLTSRHTSAYEKSQFVFRVLDSSDNGLLSIHELSKLLETWGMPGKEALRTIKELLPHMKEVRDLIKAAHEAQEEVDINKVYTTHNTKYNGATVGLGNDSKLSRLHFFSSVFKDIATVVKENGKDKMEGGCEVLRETLCKTSPGTKLKHLLEDEEEEKRRAKIKEESIGPDVFYVCLAPLWSFAFQALQDKVLQANKVEKAEKKANTALAEAAEKNAEEEEAAARADRVLDDTSLKALSEYRP